MDEARQDKVEGRQKRTMLLLGGVAASGLIASVAYGAQFEQSQFVSVVAAAVILATGSAIAGGLIGFLFALPRGTRVDSREPHAENRDSDTPAPWVAEAQSRREAITRPNTNLEDISDWLTKILVGVGLTQLASLGDALGRLSTVVAPLLGGAESSAAFGLALLITFSLTGFVTGYLWTRLYIPAAFERAETDVRAELQALREEAARTRKATVETRIGVEELAAYSGGVVESATTQVQEQVTRAMQQLGHSPSAASRREKSPMDRARRCADEYDQVRQSMPSGPARTFEMARIVSRVRSMAKVLQLPPADIRRLFSEGTGGRIVALALIAETPDVGFVDLIRHTIAEPLSAFEQYQALTALKSMMESQDLPQPVRRDFRIAIEEQMRLGPGRFITADSQRWSLAETILRAI